MSLLAFSTTIRFAEGAIASLAQDLAAAGTRRPLVVTDRGVLAAGLVDRVLDRRLRRKVVAAVYDATPNPPSEAAATEALALYRVSRADGLLAIGGTGPIDLAKAVALLASHAGPLENYAAASGGTAKIGATPPIVAVPTGLGSGAEVARFAVIVTGDGRRLTFHSRHLGPTRALCDPDLAASLPPALAAASGIDAIAHCIESFLSPRDNPPADAIALDGLARAAGFVRTFVEDRSDGRARREMMMAALQGGLASQKGLGAVHALSHQIGGGPEPPPLSHGALNGVFLPHVLAFNAPAAPEKFARLRQALGLRTSAGLADWASGLASSLRLPARLSAMGVAADALDAAAPNAAADHSARTNPRPLDAEDAGALLRAAW